MPLRSFALASLAVFALQGCRIEKPSTVVPPPPTVELFTASAAQVATGGKVTLSWKTSHAASIELAEISSGELPAAADALEGTFEAIVERDSLFVLTARGAGGTDARAVSVVVDDPAGEVNLHALPPVIPAGAGTTLVWTAPGAQQVTLSDGSQDLDLRGQRSSGALAVSPRFDTSYTLTADGRTSAVTVDVQPAVLSLEATPRAVEAGATVTLSWTAGGAERVVVSSPGRGQLAEITDRLQIASGSFNDTAPALPAGGVVTYVLEAISGSARLSRQIEVYVGVGLEIVRFDAPPVAAAGASYSVRWQTIAADVVELKVDGLTIYRATGNLALAGSFAFTAPTRDFATELVATSNRGARATQLAQVDSVGVPTSATLTAAPSTVTVGQPVTLTFACAEARRVRITTNEGEAVFSATGQRAESGAVTLYPTRDTTYTLQADNLLGNPPVTATAQVTAGGTAPSVIQVPPTALSGQMVHLAAQPGALLTGFPHDQVLLSGQADFLDIAGTGAKVLESGGNVASVDLPFSTRLWGTVQSGPITISRAGWMAWGAPLNVNSTETTLPSTSTSAVPGLLAPFWDNLTLTANSGVFVELVGDAPSQELIVQWNRLQVGTSTGTEVTFQARVHQTGRLSFQYKTMDLPASPSFTIGVQDQTRTLAVTSTGAPTSNSARYFFSPMTGGAHVRVTKTSRYGGFVSLGNLVTPVSSPAVSFAVPTDVLVTELMFRPNPALPAAQYVELFNRTTSSFDLTGWSLASSTGTSFDLPSGYLLTPGFTVIGASTDPALNDDAGVSLSWGSLTLSADGGSLTFRNADAGLTQPFAGPADGGVGASLEVDLDAIGPTAGALLSCEATVPFGGQLPPQRGTPGQPGTCLGYSRQSIPVHFVDISDGGTALLNGTPGTDGGIPTIDGRTIIINLAATGTDPAPIVFGARTPDVSMSIDGWMTWESTTSTSFSNPTTPSASMNGKIAPFWDDLHTTPSTAPRTELYWKRIEPNEDPLAPGRHWIFQWAHVRHYNTSPFDDLNFEVKLFEDGTVEYHYGVMTSGTSSNYADGNSATVWLANAAGFALAQSINAPLVQPNSAVRFAPR